jgi:hypothetical protein
VRAQWTRFATQAGSTPRPNRTALTRSQRPAGTATVPPPLMQETAVSTSSVSRMTKRGKSGGCIWIVLGSPMYSVGVTKRPVSSLTVMVGSAVAEGSGTARLRRSSPS